MSSGAIVTIVVVVLVVAALAGWTLTTTRRRRLQRRFGPEYDRVVSEQHSHRRADHELAARQRRVRSLEIRPLTAQARASYAGQWASVQERFVDEPAEAVTNAQLLVVAVMHERGYPTEDHDQVTADLSVEHSGTLVNYRAAQEISVKAADGAATTEELRQAMIHYRLLFDELLTDPARSVPGGTPTPDAGRSAPGAVPAPPTESDNGSQAATDAGTEAYPAAG
jgi:hypothetical protein